MAKTKRQQRRRVNKRIRRSARVALKGNRPKVGIRENHRHNRAGRYIADVEVLG
ncbi:MAG: hypothetical protein OXG79_12630 [Chloroflexi bacterium]|nr:hypothetical protein [Chloroflexota bacterium]